MKLIDIGANLSHDSFKHDLPSVLERTKQADVDKIVVTGASRQGSIDAKQLADQHPDFLYATAGLHPHHASEYDAEHDELFRQLVSHKNVVAVGEMGLDYFRDLSPRAAQWFAFEQQLQIAIDCGKPLFLHQRDAHEDFLAIMKTSRDKISRAVVHCFTDEKKALFDYLDMDLYIGITGWICDERRGQHLRKLVKSIPADRLMIETDSPYLMPRNLEPKPSHRRNEPCFLPHICAEVARDRGEAIEVTAAQTRATAMAFFGLK